MINKNQWKNLETKKPFRLILTDYGNPISWSTISNTLLLHNLLFWRINQCVDKPEQIILKFGHGNGFDDCQYINQIKKILDSGILNDYHFMTIKICIYQHLDSVVNPELYFQYVEMKKAYPHILFCACHIVDDHSQIPFALSRAHEFYNDEIYSIVFLSDIFSEHNKNEYEKLGILLESLYVFGIDFSSSVSNLNSDNPRDLQFTHRFDYILNSYNNNPNSFYKIISPESFELFQWIERGHLEDKNLLEIAKQQLHLFLSDGFIIDVSTEIIHPLINGSSDDFCLGDGLSQQHILSCNLDSLCESYFQMYLKKFVKSQCMICDKFSVCGEKRLWWLNFIKGNYSHKNCSIGVLEYFKNKESP